jgi:aspartyl-tRNA(Asn)/glutamyl-tRNA(Gln) amidotransferase subunit A
LTDPYNAFIRTDVVRGADSGPLAGMRISIKDLIDIAGLPTTAASRVRMDHVAERNAPVVQRLLDAGATLIGKTNLHEFAFGTTSEESAFGMVHNPRDVTRSPGGSSGGSAAAVAAGIGDASIGTDTGGSIRIPAAACGIVGLKPAFGDVPTDGVVPLSKTLDHVGPLTRSVADAARIWSVIAAQPAPDLAPRPFKLGVLGGYFTELLDVDVRAAFCRAIERLPVEPRIVRGTESIVETYLNISLPEAAHWHSHTIDTRPDDYQRAVLERLLRGRSIAAVDYLRALDEREMFRDAVNEALAGVDALMLPSLAIVAPKHGQSEVTVDNGVTIPVRAAMLRLTQPFNVTGHPAISIPIPTGGLPVGLQLVGTTTAELLRVAAMVERLVS